MYEKENVEWFDSMVGWSFYLGIKRGAFQTDKDLIFNHNQNRENDVTMTFWVSNLVFE